MIGSRARPLKVTVSPFRRTSSTLDPGKKKPLPNPFTAGVHRKNEKKEKNRKPPRGRTRKYRPQPNQSPPEHHPYRRRARMLTNKDHFNQCPSPHRPRDRRTKMRDSLVKLNRATRIRYIHRETKRTASRSAPQDRRALRKSPYTKSPTASFESDLLGRGRNECCEKSELHKYMC